MKQFQLPPQKVALVRSLVSLVLLTLILIFSFTPMITIDTGNAQMRETIQSGLDELENSVDGFEAFEIPEKIGVTMPTLIKADTIFVQTISLLISGVDSMTDQTVEQQEKLEERMNALIETAASVEGQKAITVMLALIGQIADLSNGSDTPDTEIPDIDEILGEIDAEDGETEKTEAESSVGSVILTVIRVIVMLYILFFITLLPIIVAIGWLIALIRLLTSLKDPETKAGKIACAPMRYLGTAVAFMLALSLYHGMELGYGLIAIVVCVLLAVVANVAASRARAYSASDLRFVNLTQGSVLLGVIGGVLFFANALKTKILVSFCDAFGTFIENMTISLESINGMVRSYNSYVPAGQKLSEVTGDLDWLIDVGLIFVFAIMTLSLACTIMTNSAARIGLTVAKNGKSSFISLGITGIIASILPMIASGMEHAKTYTAEITGGRLQLETEVVGSIYTLSDESKTHLILMLVGSVLMLAVGIATSVLRKKYCADVTEERAMMILKGAAPAAKAVETIVVTVDEPADETDGETAEEASEAPAKEETPAEDAAPAATEPADAENAENSENDQQV